jgi:hypothetical protein
LTFSQIIVSMQSTEKRQNQGKGIEISHLRVAEKGAIRPCTVLTLACIIPSPVSAPEFGVCDVVGRYIFIGMLRRGVPGGLSSLLLMVLNFVRLSIFI